jgi:hypothetical protein
VEPARAKASAPAEVKLRPVRVRLADWHRSAVYVVVALVTASGAGWLVCHYLLAPASEDGPLPHPLEGFWLSLHGVTATLAVFAFGSLLTIHMVRAWALRRSRGGGALLTGALLLLTLSGLGLYYVGDEAWREALGLGHWLLGIALPAILVLHVWLGRRGTEEG